MWKSDLIDVIEHTVKPKTIKLRSTQKSVVQFDLKGNKIAEFSSIKEASDVTGVRNSGISACCCGVYKVSNGFIWVYKENEHKVMPNQKTVSARAKRVIKCDKNTGKELQEYESATAAGKDVGTRAHNISDACNGRSKTSAGFMWRFMWKFMWKFAL